MISVELARKLRDQGLDWVPALYDFFAIPDADLDDRIFVISDLTIDVETLAGHATIMFNGAVEWSLDYILSQDAVWLPTESQLRTLLGDNLVGLSRADGDAWRCELTFDGMSMVFSATDDPSECYGNALLHLLFADNPDGVIVPETSDLGPADGAAWV